MFNSSPVRTRKNNDIIVDYIYVYTTRCIIYCIALYISNLYFRVSGTMNYELYELSKLVAAVYKESKLAD